MDRDKLKHAAFIIFPSTIVLLLLLAGFQALPLGSLSIDAMRNVGLQQTRSQVIAKNALIICYVSDQFTRTQAIGDLEVALPQFEAQQATMSNYRDPGLQSIISQSRADYLAIDVAAKMVLAQSSGVVDKDQMSIILVHSHSYSGTLSQVALALQQAATDALLRIFYIEIAIDGGVIVLIVVLALILRGNAKTIQRDLSGAIS